MNITAHLLVSPVHTSDPHRKTCKASPKCLALFRSTTMTMPLLYYVSILIYIFEIKSVLCSFLSLLYLAEHEPFTGK